MHAFLCDAVEQKRLSAADGKEYTLNHVFQAALDNGMVIEPVVFKSGVVRDVGTPGDLLEAQYALLADASKRAMEKK
jgi:NDP-sugar pyrophosphorylase family protein